MRPRTGQIGWFMVGDGGQAFSQVEITAKHLTTNTKLQGVPLPGNDTFTIEPSERQTVTLQHVTEGGRTGEAVVQGSLSGR